MRCCRADWNSMSPCPLHRHAGNCGNVPACSPASSERHFLKTLDRHFTSSIPASHKRLIKYPRVDSWATASIPADRRLSLGVATSPSVMLFGRNNRARSDLRNSNSAAGCCGTHVAIRLPEYLTHHRKHRDGEKSSSTLYRRQEPAESCGSYDWRCAALIRSWSWHC